MSAVKENLIKTKSFDFALEVISLFKQLKDEKEYVISKQILRSGTSIGANIEEAGAAISRKEFIHKMAIASKEARETSYWIRLLKHSELTNIPMDPYLEKITSINNILSKIVKSSQENQKP